MAQWWEHLPPTNVAHAGSNPGINAILIYRVEFFVGSLLCSERFSPGTPVFLSSQTQTFPNSYSTRNKVDEEPLCGCATSKSLLLFIIIYYYLLSSQCTCPETQRPEFSSCSVYQQLDLFLSSPENIISTTVNCTYILGTLRCVLWLTSNTGFSIIVYLKLFFKSRWQKL